MANSRDGDACLFTRQSRECGGLAVGLISHFRQGAALQMGDAPRHRALTSSGGTAQHRGAKAFISEQRGADIMILFLM